MQGRIWLQKRTSSLKKLKSVEFKISQKAVDNDLRRRQEATPHPDDRRGHRGCRPVHRQRRGLSHR